MPTHESYASAESRAQLTRWLASCDGTAEQYDDYGYLRELHSVAEAVETPSIMNQPFRRVGSPLANTKMGELLRAQRCTRLLVTDQVTSVGTLQGVGSDRPETQEWFRDDTHTTSDGRSLPVNQPTGPQAVIVTVSLPDWEIPSVAIRTMGRFRLVQRHELPTRSGTRDRTAGERQSSHADTWS